MTFEELKKRAAENGTQAGVLVSSLAAAMVERGGSDERLLNLVEIAKEQGTQGGALLIVLLDVMYDLGYNEDILDELWEGCLQQGNQSSAIVTYTADFAFPDFFAPKTLGGASNPVLSEGVYYAYYVMKSQEQERAATLYKSGAKVPDAVSISASLSTITEQTVEVIPELSEYVGWYCDVVQVNASGLSEGNYTIGYETEGWYDESLTVKVTA